MTCSLLLFLAASILASPAPEKYPDTLTLRNKNVKVVVSASMGRVIGFSVDGREYFKQHLIPTTQLRARGKHKIVAYGGNRIWPHKGGKEMMTVLGRMFPLDSVFDHGIWTTEKQSSTSITLLSPVSPKLGIRVRRTISLSSSGVLSILEDVFREHDGPLDAVVWNITELRFPRKIIVGSSEIKPGWKVKLNASNNSTMENATVLEPKEQLFHVITKAKWSAAVYERVVIVQSHARRLNAIVWGNPEKNYIELESKGAYYPIKAGEHIKADIIIQALQIDNKLSDTEIIRLIQKNIPRRVRR